MPYFDIKFTDGVMHVLYALYDRDNMANLNVSHITIVGLPRQDDYIIPSMLDPYARLSRNILDIVIDENMDLWYIYRTDYDMFGVKQDTFGIGIAKLENSIANYTTSLDIPEVTYDIDEIQTQRGVDGLFSFMFVETRKVHWCNFDGTQIRKESQSITYNNPIDFIYTADSENKHMLLTNLQDNGEYITNYYGYFEAGIWSYIPIPTQKPIGLDDYNSYLDLENYLITYVTVLNPSNFAPEGLEFRETSGLALKILSSNDLDTSFLMIGFTSFNPRKEFWQKNWELIAVSIVGSLAGIGLLTFLWIKSSKKIKRFFFDSQVGDFNKFFLAFLNIWRVFSNFGGLIKSIWLSNKKRTILTIIGFVITGYLISSALVIAQSEESAMIKAYYRANPMISNRLATGIIDTTFFSPSEPANISETYGFQANQELIDLYSNSHMQNYIGGIDSAFYFLSKVYSPNYTMTQDYRMTGLPDSTDDYFSTIITEGRAPQNSNEILIRGDVARLAHVGINDTFSMIASKEDVGSEVQDYPTNEDCRNV